MCTGPVCPDCLALYCTVVLTTLLTGFPCLTSDLYWVSFKSLIEKMAQKDLQPAFSYDTHDLLSTCKWEKQKQW